MKWVVVSLSTDELRNWIVWDRFLWWNKAIYKKKCNDRKIKVLCDIVINHMARLGLDITQDSTYDVYGAKKQGSDLINVLSMIMQMGKFIPKKDFPTRGQATTSIDMVACMTNFTVTISQTGMIQIIIEQGGWKVFRI